MPKQPIPLSVATDISNRAVVLAKLGMARRGWSDRTSSSIVASPGVGKIAIRATAKHLMYQNKGIRPFLMTSLEGKVVPIKGAGLFRVKGVGLPGMGYQNRKNNPIKGSIWREQRWRHPGIKPERFLENAISQAIMEARPRLRSMVVGSIAQPGQEVQAALDRAELERDRRVTAALQRQGQQSMRRYNQENR